MNLIDLYPNRFCFRFIKAGDQIMLKHVDQYRDYFKQGSIYEVLYVKQCDKNNRCSKDCTLKSTSVHFKVMRDGIENDCASCGCILASPSGIEYKER